MTEQFEKWVTQADPQDMDAISNAIFMPSTTEMEKLRKSLAFNNAIGYNRDNLIGGDEKKAKL